MPDYHCWPLWHHGGEIVGNIDPKEIGISSDLADRISSSAKVYDSHLKIDDPASTSWTRGEEVEFESVGRALCHELADEVGDRFDIFYFDSSSRSVVQIEKTRT